LLFSGLFGACTKDSLNDEGFVKVYNDFVIFGKTQKTSDRGFLVLTTDNVYDNRRYAIKTNDNGEVDWKAFLDYNSSGDASRTVIKNFVNIAETPDGMALVLVEMLDPLGLGIPPVLKFIKVNPDGTTVDTASVANPFLNSGVDNITFSRLIVANDNSGNPAVSLLGITTTGNIKGIGVVQFNLGANLNVADNDTPIVNSKHHFFISEFSSAFSIDLVQIRRTNDNGFVVLAPGNRSAFNGFMMKLDNSLNEQWRYYHRSGVESKYLIDATEMANNQWMVLGQAGYLDRSVATKNDDDFWVMLIDNANGDVLKETRYRDIDDSGNSTIKADANVARAITPLANGNFLLVGDQSDYTSTGGIDSHTEGTNLYMLEITADAGATPVRRVIIESSFGMHGNDIIELVDGGYLALCSKHSFGFQQYRDMVLMKVFPDGNFVR
jgi:hypothetical protein